MQPPTPLISQPPSDHFNGSRFFYPGAAAERGLGDLLRWKLTSRAARWPRHVPVARPTAPPGPREQNLVVTWIGHATFLLQSPKSTWLTDPVFSDRIGPVRGFGPRRVSPPAIRLEELPAIDGILLSHDHYDHCDLPSLRALAARNATLVVVAPLNYTALLKPICGRENLVELDWWQSWLGPGNASIQLVPARHWCRRRIGGTNERLWGGFLLRLGAQAVYFAGDTGFDRSLFSAIASRCGHPDLALLPIGAYEPRWFMSGAHMSPAEAVEAHCALGARRSLAMHWGTFQLTDEAYDDPVKALGAARTAAGVAADKFAVPPPGSTLVIP